MEEKVYIPIHQTLKVGMMLAVVGGFLDAYTYLLAYCSKILKNQMNILPSVFSD